MTFQLQFAVHPSQIKEYVLVQEMINQRSVVRLMTPQLSDSPSKGSPDAQKVKLGALRECSQ